MKNNRFTLPEGVKVTDLTGIKEGYNVVRIKEKYFAIRINVSAEHIAPYFLDLTAALEEPGFFVVELPVSVTEEKSLRKKDSDPCHKHVFYLDGISRKQAQDILEKYQNTFVNDGMVNFGFGSITHEEVYVGAYKLFEIFTPEPEKFRGILQSMGIEYRENLRTVRDNIGPDNPGERCTIESRPNTHDMLSEVMKRGFYIADTRED